MTTEFWWFKGKVWKHMACEGVGNMNFWMDVVVVVARE
jgi:hypothetical protein